MDFRFYTAGFFIALVAMMLGCGAADMEASDGEADPCPGSCPDDWEPVDFCPAFTTCETVPDCGDILTCAPPEEPNDSTLNDEQNQSPDAVDCGEPMRCPEGSIEVPGCPEGANCTRITLCEADLLCQEVPQMCLFEARCPDGDRHVQDCQDEACYSHHHCSGPVDCLRCDESLPTECPVGTREVECDPGEERCERVETCDETLTCLSMCIENPICLGSTTEVANCEETDRACFTIEGCEQPLHCAAPEEICEEEDEEEEDGGNDEGGDSDGEEEPPGGEGDGDSGEGEGDKDGQDEGTKEGEGEEEEPSEEEPSEEEPSEEEEPEESGEEESEESTEEEQQSLCPSGYDEVELQTCLDNYYTCSIITECGEITACVPAG